MSLEAWLTFVGIWIVAGIPLGPNAFNCIATCVAVGFKKSLLCVLGILLAAVVFITIVASGLAALLIANSAVFSIIKIMGAVYIIWLGINLYRKRGQQIELKAQTDLSAVKIVKNSFLISMSNPKAILSYGAVFSQFIDPNQEVSSQLMVLAPTALVIVALIYLGYCWLGIGVEKLLNSRRRMTIFNKVMGAAYVAAGAAILGYEVAADSPI